MKNKPIVFLIVYITFGLFLFVPIGRASTELVEVKEDSDVRSDEPDTNYGDEETIAAGVNFDDTIITYIQFDISNLIPSDIERIQLRLRVTYIVLGLGVIKLSFVESNWVEESITYNTQPSLIEFTSQFWDAKLIAGDYMFFSIKKDYLNQGNVISFKIEKASGMVIYHSKEGGVTGNNPTVVITYAEPFVFPLWAIPIIIVGALVGVGSFFVYKYFRKLSKIRS
jgi:hypothetical protein